VDQILHAVVDLTKAKRRAKKAFGLHLDVVKLSKISRDCKR
jgi:hypothetical protein